jgi:hypothetical protein
MSTYYLKTLLFVILFVFTYGEIGCECNKKHSEKVNKKSHKPCRGTCRYLDGSFYVGGLNNSQANEKEYGKIEFKHGGLCRGTFVNDKITFGNCYTYNFKQYYKGGFYEGRVPHDNNAKVILGNDEYGSTHYDGPLKFGSKEGIGRLYINQKNFNTITYYGNFEKDSPNGDGKVKIEQGTGLLSDIWFDSKKFDVNCVQGVCKDVISKEIVFNYNNQNDIWYEWWSQFTR